jgi:hypothetical protein
MLRRAREKSGIRQHIATVKQARRGKCNLVLSVFPSGIMATLEQKDRRLRLLQRLTTLAIKRGVTADWLGGGRACENK